MTLIPELQHDLVAAAARVSTRRQRFRLRLGVTAAVVAAAALVAAALVVVGGGGADRAPSSGEPAGPPDNPPDSTVPEPPPPSLPRPVPGTLSRAVEFTFRETRYSVVGFIGSRSAGQRNTMICTRLAEVPPDPARPLPSQMCAGEQLLRRELDDNPVRTVARGGGEYTHVSGFARADVTGIAVVAPRYPNRAVLSQPWSPPGWRGNPIRFFWVVIDPPRRADPEFPRRGRIRLQGRLIDGETVEGVP